MPFGIKLVSLKGTDEICFEFDPGFWTLLIPSNLMTLRNAMEKSSTVGV